MISYNVPRRNLPIAISDPSRWHDELAGMHTASTPGLHVSTLSCLQHSQAAPSSRGPHSGQKAHPPPPPEMVGGEEHYVVDWVLDSQLMRGQLQFLVKWEGYGYEENSWVLESDIAAPDKIQEFYNAHPGAPRRICSVAFHSLISRALRTQHARRGGDVRGWPVFCSEAVLEFCQLQPQTPSALFGLQPPPSSRDTSKYFLFRAPL